jgi:hypothetical protein
MAAPDNTLSDFPAKAFTVFVWCDVCGHQGAVDRGNVPESIPMQTPQAKLVCSACGARQVSIRIAYTGAGGFSYHGTTPGADPD